MFNKCRQSTNTGGEKCAECGTQPENVHKAGPLFRRHPYCPKHCPIHVPAQQKGPQALAPVQQSATPSSDYGAPAGSKDPWYRDTRKK
jgi:hypothetical protein